MLLASCSARSDDLDDAEVTFLQDMWHHHEQAVRMALLVLDGDDAAEITRSFAVDVIASQRHEMGMMDGYLLAAGEERAAAGAHGAMPGMASAEQLEALATASESRLDAIFLDLMIEHHHGGIAMAEDALDDDLRERISDLAERIRNTQRLEIADMEAAQEVLGVE